VCRMDREVVTRVATGESWSEELEAVWARGRDTEDRSSVPRVRVSPRWGERSRGRGRCTWTWIYAWLVGASGVTGPD
jgi:hypothetical protein